MQTLVTKHSIYENKNAQKVKSMSMYREVAWAEH